MFHNALQWLATLTFADGLLNPTTQALPQGKPLSPGKPKKTGAEEGHVISCSSLSKVKGHPIVLKHTFQIQSVTSSSSIDNN